MFKVGDWIGRKGDDNPCYVITDFDPETEVFEHTHIDDKCWVYYATSEELIKKGYEVYPDQEKRDKEFKTTLIHRLNYGRATGDEMYWNARGWVDFFKSLGRL